MVFIREQYVTMMLSVKLNNRSLWLSAPFAFLPSVRSPIFEYVDPSQRLRRI